MQAVNLLFRSGQFMHLVSSTLVLKMYPEVGSPRLRDDPLAATSLLPLRVPSIQQSVDWWFARKLTTVLCPLFSDAFNAFVNLDGSLVLLALKTSQHHLLLF